MSNDGGVLIFVDLKEGHSKMSDHDREIIEEMMRKCKKSDDDSASNQSNIPKGDQDET